MFDSILENASFHVILAAFKVIKLNKYRQFLGPTGSLLKFKNIEFPDYFDQITCQGHIVTTHRYIRCFGYKLIDYVKYDKR